MTSNIPKVYTDEDVHGVVARELRLRGHDALSAPESGKLGIKDDKQLEFAISQGRALLSFNTRDFRKLHEQYITESKKHYGIIISKRLPVGVTVKAMLNLLSNRSGKEMINKLEWLSRWIDI